MKIRDFIEETILYLYDELLSEDDITLILNVLDEYQLKPTETNIADIFEELIYCE